MLKTNSDLHMVYIKYKILVHMKNFKCKTLINNLKVKFLHFFNFKSLRILKML